MLSHNVSQFHGSMSTRSGKRTFLSGANMGFERSLLSRMGGFRPDRTLVDDIELSFRLRLAGHHVWYDPNATITHVPEGLTKRRAGWHHSMHY